jgi:FKBP-type peptidyl-prolyl cis-trans isomerase
MNKDNFWNFTIGILSAVLIGGGAYVMMTGGLIKKGNPDAQVATLETATDSNVNVARGEAQEEIAKNEITTPVAGEKELLKQTKTLKTMIQDGVTVEIKKEGTGTAVKSGQTAVVHYTGMFTDGKVFDSSIPRGQAFPVQLGAGMVIKGWDVGLVGMKVGEQRRLTIPSELGYGANGAGGIIPPNTTLVFDVELMKIK